MRERGKGGKGREGKGREKRGGGMKVETHPPSNV